MGNLIDKLWTVFHKIPEPFFHRQSNDPMIPGDHTVQGPDKCLSYQRFKFTMIFNERHKFRIRYP